MLVVMTLSPRWRKALLTTHIVTALGWLGVDAVLATLAAAGLAGYDPDVVYPAAALVGTVLLGPLTVLAWVVGVLNGLLTRWGVLTWWWVVVKLVITTGMVGMVLLVLTPTLRTAGELGALLPAEDRLSLLMAPSVSGTLLILATVLSTYKPWGRLNQPKPIRRTVDA